MIYGMFKQLSQKINLRKLMGAYAGALNFVLTSCYLHTLSLL